MLKVRESLHQNAQQLEKLKRSWPLNQILKPRKARLAHSDQATEPLWEQRSKMSRKRSPSQFRNPQPQSKQINIKKLKAMMVLSEDLPDFLESKKILLLLKTFLVQKDLLLLLWRSQLKQKASTWRIALIHSRIDQTHPLIYLCDDPSVTESPHQRINQSGRQDKATELPKTAKKQRRFKVK